MNTLKPRAVTTEDADSIRVIVYWDGAKLDRRTSGGWSVPLRHRALAQRLAFAINAGVACPYPSILTDVNGKTYVTFDTVVLGRTMNADLKRLGF